MNDNVASHHHHLLTALGTQPQPATHAPSASTSDGEHTPVCGPVLIEAWRFRGHGLCHAMEVQ